METHKNKTPILGTKAILLFTLYLQKDLAMTLLVKEAALIYTVPSKLSVLWKITKIDMVSPFLHVIVPLWALKKGGREGKGGYSDVEMAGILWVFLLGFWLSVSGLGIFRMNYQDTQKWCQIVLGWWAKWPTGLVCCHCKFPKASYSILRQQNW